MPENKYLWRGKIRRVSTPVYLVAQNPASAVAALHSHPEVEPEDIQAITRLALWDEAKNMTVVAWPSPPPEPEPDEEPPI